MNKRFYYIITGIILVLLQVFILNNILLFGYVNPYIYIAFIFFFPLKRDRFLFLFFSFLMGLFVDFFSDSGGIHAFATLFIAFTRLFFIKTIFKKSDGDFPFFNLKEEPFGKFFNYVVILTITHHFILFLLENFSFQNFSNLLLNTLYSSVFTLLLFFAGNHIFSKNLS